jgi:hypothetical protein
MNVLNHLSLIKDNIVRHQALTAAQMVSLKAYRGAPYAEAPHQEHVSAELMYRGARVPPGAVTAARLTTG